MINRKTNDFISYLWILVSFRLANVLGTIIIAIGSLISSQNAFQEINTRSSSIRNNTPIFLLSPQKQNKTKTNTTEKSKKVLKTHENVKVGIAFIKILPIMADL